MTPKEKAKELFGLFYIACQEYTEEIQCSIQAEHCALIYVDEITKENDDIEYWHEVRNELIKL